MRQTSTLRHAATPRHIFSTLTLRSLHSISGQQSIGIRRLRHYATFMAMHYVWWVASDLRHFWTLCERRGGAKRAQMPSSDKRIHILRCLPPP